MGLTKGDSVEVGVGLLPGRGENVGVGVELPGEEEDIGVGVGLCNFLIAYNAA